MAWHRAGIMTQFSDARSPDRNGLTGEHPSKFFLVMLKLSLYMFLNE